MAYKHIAVLIAKAIIAGAPPAVLSVYGFASAYLAFRDPDRWFNAGWTPKRGMDSSTTDGDIRAMGVLSFVFALGTLYFTVRLLWGTAIILWEQLSKIP